MFKFKTSPRQSEAPLALAMQIGVDESAVCLQNDSALFCLLTNESADCLQNISVFY